MDFNTVRIAFIPALQHATLGEFTDVGVDRIADVEAELLSLACHEPLLECLRVKVTTDEHETAFSLFAFFPKTDFFAELTTKEHVDALEDKFCIHALHGENAFVAEQVLALLPHELTDPRLEFVHVEFTNELVAR